MLTLSGEVTLFCERGTICLDKNIRRREYKDMQADAWAALSEGRRRAILDHLRGGGRSVNDVAAALGLSQPQTSKHLRVLREAGLVRCRVHAQQRIYSVEAAAMRGVEEWLAPYRALWNTHLDRLDAHLGAHDDGTAESADHPQEET